MGEQVPRTEQGWMAIATMPVGTFWTCVPNKPLAECKEEAVKLGEIPPVGYAWWMPFKRAIN